MKKLLSFIAALVLLSCFAFSAFAEGSTPPPEEISDDPTHAGTFWYDYSRAGDELKITATSSSFDIASSSSVYVTGSTTANLVADTIGGTFVIEQWTNKGWKKYTDKGFLTVGTSYAEGSKTISVDPGYYYRMTIYHTAVYLDTSRSKTSTTKSLYVG